MKADAGYGSYENYEYIESKKIDGYIPDQQIRRLRKLTKEKKIPPYEKSQFKYDSKKDVYYCPEKEELRLEKRDKKKRIKIYKCYSCERCKKHKECSSSKNRTITRHESEELQEKMRAKLSTAEGKRKYYERMNMIESIFGHFKKNLKFKQFSLRGLEKVRGEFKLLCIGHNIKKIHKWKMGLNMI